MINWSVYDAFMNAYGETEDERAVNRAKEDFLIEAVDNPDYRPNCLRNGVQQRFLVERTDVPYKTKFVTFPDEEIYPGDIIECDGHVFIIIEPPRFLERVTWAAVGRLCNLDLRWQDFDGNICNSYASLDAGVYSTTINGTDTVQAPDKQFKLYLPYNEQTATLYLDKRIAVDTRYDQFGKKILECYRITGTNRVAKTYGTGGHLLIAELRSSPFSEQRDNVEQMICDWIEPDSGQNKSCHRFYKSEISGRQQIRMGTTSKYNALFYDRYNQRDEQVVASWSVSAPQSVTSSEMDGVLSVCVPKDESLIGETITLALSANDSEAYRIISMEIEVIG